MWKRFLCLVFGHRIARLEGRNHPVILWSSPESGLEVRTDMCYRCGVLFSNLKRLDVAEVEKVMLLSNEEKA